MPQLPRIQAFEFNDLPTIPSALRDTIVESLSLTLRWGRVLRQAVPHFEEFLRRCGTDEVLDLCAGAAGPARILVEEIKGAGRTPPRVVLTDLFPRLEVWGEAVAAHPQAIAIEADPVDATAIPESLSRGRARMVINAFHHFPPSLAQAIVTDAVRCRAGLFIAEGFSRNPLQILNLAFAGLPALFLNPLLAHRENVAKAALTWLTPIVAGVALWDGVVSTLRIHERGDLMAMAEAAGGDYEWEYRPYRYPPLGVGHCFFGVPRRG